MCVFKLRIILLQAYADAFSKAMPKLLTSAWLAMTYTHQATDVVGRYDNWPPYPHAAFTREGGRQVTYSSKILSYSCSTSNEVDEYKSDSYCT